jgi:hypothetical protein
VKKGDNVKLVGSLSFYPLEYGVEGTVVEVDEKENESLVNFGNPGSFFVKNYDLRVTKPSVEMNDRERLKEEYHEWVDRVSEDCDWKTNFTIEEIKEKWSEITLNYALKIIDECLELNSDQKLVMLINKKSEIKKLL